MRYGHFLDLPELFLIDASGETGSLLNYLRHPQGNIEVTLLKPIRFGRNSDEINFTLKIRVLVELLAYLSALAHGLLYVWVT